MPFYKMHLRVKRKIDIYFKIFLILLLLLFSQQGESYSQQEKDVKNFDKSELTINTLVY